MFTLNFTLFKFPIVDQIFFNIYIVVWGISMPIGDPCSKSKSSSKVEFGFFNFKAFSNPTNF
jgi:hypothetical protein